MSVPANPSPDPGDQPGPLQRRIGDAERDRAATYLQEHMAQGRLDGEEFDERLTKALGAKTAADLAPLFHDLPEPRPAELERAQPFSPPPWSASGAQAVVPASDPPQPTVPERREREDGLPHGAGIAMAAVWPAAIILSFATGFEHWWIWVVAVVVTMFIRQAFGVGDRDRQRRIQDRRDRRDGPPSLDR